MDFLHGLMYIVSNRVEIIKDLKTNKQQQKQTNKTD